MLIVKSPQISLKKNDAILSAEILFNNKKETVWYSVPKEYKEYLCYERSDAFVIPLLLFAMDKGLDIKSEQVMSEKLYFSLTKYLIPFLCHINPKLKKIDIVCEVDNHQLPSASNVGTGISCGVDSLSTVLYHGKEQNKGSFTINMLTLFNSGYYGHNENSFSIYRKYIKQSSDFSKNFGYPLLIVNSNISIVTKYNFLQSHTYLTCSVVLAIQKLFKIYYYASGYSIYDFKASFDDPAYYDVFLLDCISTENVKFISSNTIMNRIDKIEYLLKHKKYIPYLYVCTSGNPPMNCGKCEKCTRTLLAIDSLGALDVVSQNFNVKIYKLKRNINIATMLLKKNKNVFYREIYNSFKKNNIEIPIVVFLLIPISLLQIIFNTLVSRIKLYLRKRLCKKQIEFLLKMRGKR